ncbi:MAG TPA: hypothetical protein V6D03_11305, partial [Candidatus Caenarcaniphilales bacterium]
MLSISGALAVVSFGSRAESTEVGSKSYGLRSVYTKQQAASATTIAQAAEPPAQPAQQAQAGTPNDPQTPATTPGTPETSPVAPQDTQGPNLAPDPQQAPPAELPATPPAETPTPVPTDGGIPAPTTPGPETPPALGPNDPAPAAEPAPTEPAVEPVPTEPAPAEPQAAEEPATRLEYITFVKTTEGAATREIADNPGRFSEIVGSGRLLVNADNQVTGYYFTVSGLEASQTLPYHFHNVKNGRKPATCEGDKGIVDGEVG